MSRSFGGSRFTTSPPIFTVPLVIGSRPAIIRRAVVFIAALVAARLGLAVYLSFTNATAGSLSGKWVGLANFRHEWGNASFQDAVWHTFLFTVFSQIVVLLVAGLLAHALLKDF